MTTVTVEIPDGLTAEQAARCERLVQLAPSVYVAFMDLLRVSGDWPYVHSDGGGRCECKDCTVARARLVAEALK